MSIIIDKKACRKCGQCVEACPGNLIKPDEEGLAYMNRPKECWGCTACLKECSFGAIRFYLGADIGGAGSCMTTTREGDLRTWTVIHPDGREESIVVNLKESNKY